MIFSESFRERTRTLANAFFLGDGYPFFVGAVTLLGYVSGKEFFLNLLNMLLLTAALVLTRSTLPLIPAFTMYIFSTSQINSPEEHVSSDYYHSPVIIGGIILSITLVLLTSVYILVKEGRFSRKILSSLPFPLASVFLTLAFTFSGVFYHRHTVYDVGWGIILSLEYFLLFYFFYVALRGEDTQKVIDRTVTSAAVTALLLSFETLHLYLTNDKLIVGGEIIKEQVVFGFGMWTMAGQFLAVTVPLCFLGVLRGRRAVLCFTAASLATVSAIMTLSRNALLISVTAYASFLIICCFYGKSKKMFRAILPTLATGAIVCIVIFRESLITLLSDYFDRGFSDNGRFALWEHGFSSFLSSPVFGCGFFGIQQKLIGGTPEGFSFYPRMMHNTAIQLLGATGFVGFLAYAYYRYKTLEPFFMKPTLEKTVMGISLLLIAVASLIDNFLFLPKHLIFYSVTLATVFAIDRSSADSKINKTTERI